MNYKLANKILEEHMFLSIIIPVIVIITIFIMTQHPCDNLENESCFRNGISSYDWERYHCTKAGGIFTSGGVFGSNGCSFAN